MSSLEWVDLVVLVRVRREDGRRNVGTGFVCGPGRVVTARHTIEKETPARDRRIEVTYSDAARAALEGVEVADDGSVTAELIWPNSGQEEPLDCCVLEVPTPSGAPALPFANPDRGNSMRFASWGFPNGARNASGGREGFPLAGERMHGGAAAPSLQADVCFDTEVRGGWRGYSGAPVIEEQDGRQVVVGVIVQEQQVFEKPQRLSLVPYDCLALSEGFSEALAPVWQGHDFDEARFLARLHANVAGIVADVLRQLAPEQRARIAGTAPERLANDLDQLAADLVQSPDAVIDRIGMIVLELRGVDFAMAGLVGRIGQVLHLLKLDRQDAELVSYMSTNGALSALRQSPVLHAATLAKIELLAAAVDGRSPEFPPRSAFGGDQKSRYALELHVPVSGEAGLHGLCDAAEDLRQHTGADLFEEAPDELAEFLAGHEERVLDPAEVDRRRGSARRQMRLVGRALRARPESLGRFYVVAGMPESPEARAHITHQLCELLSGIPDLLGFSMSTDEDAHEDELDALYTLDKTVPQQGSDP